MEERPWPFLRASRAAEGGTGEKSMYNDTTLGNGIQMVTSARPLKRRRQFWRDLTIRTAHEAIYEIFGAKRSAQADGGAHP